MESRESFPRRVLNATRLFIDRITPHQLRDVNLSQGEKGLRAEAMGKKIQEVELLDILKPIPTTKLKDQ